MDLADSLPELPQFSEAASRFDWLVLTGERLPYALPYEELEELWSLSILAVLNMGDIFWDADEHGGCLYCHLADEGCPNSTGTNPVDPNACGIWYGDCPSERMLCHAAAEVFATLLAVTLRSK